MKKIKHCRACGSRALSPAFAIGLGAPERRLWRNGDQSVQYVLCDPSRHARACGLLQGAMETEGGVGAPSSRHATDRDLLRAVATEALEMISGRDCAALDIGCDDGALLSFYPRWVDRFGVDPCDHIDEIGDWAWTAKEKFPAPALDAAFGEKKFDIITAVSVLEHCDQPRALLEKIKTYLTNDGVCVIETIYSPLVLTRNCVEALQADVSAVYSLSVLEWLVREAGMKIFKGALTSKNGGSIRLFITHAENEAYDFDPWSERLARLWDEENALAMRAVQPYQTFERRAEEIRAEMVEIFEQMAERGERAHIIGADDQAEAFIRWIGPSARVISAAVDTQAARERKKLGDKGPRIISETDSRAGEPDFLIAPARYKREFLGRYRESILLGAQMIFVSPRPHVVNAKNFAAEFGKALANGDAAGGVETLRGILAAAGGPRLIADNQTDAQSA